MTVLVTGVRGSIGRQVADLLHIEGVGVCGASARAEYVQGAAYPVVPLDLRDPAGLSGALEDVDAVFLYAAHDAIDEVARIMADHGVQHVVVLSSASVETPGAEALAEHHRRVEDAVAAARLPWTFLRPGAFASNTVAWAGALQTGRVAMPYPDAYVEPIHEADIADAAVSLLRRPHEADRSYFLTGGQSLTQREQVQTIAAAVGRDVVVDALSPEQWAAQVADVMPAGAAQCLLQMWHSADGRPGRIDGTVRDITGAEPRRFSQWVDDHLADFR